MKHYPWFADWNHTEKITTPQWSRSPWDPWKFRNSSCSQHLDEIHSLKTNILYTVDGRNPAAVDMVNIPLFTGFHACGVVQDFFHQQKRYVRNLTGSRATPNFFHKKDSNLHYRLLGPWFCINLCLHSYDFQFVSKNNWRSFPTPDLHSKSMSI